MNEPAWPASVGFLPGRMLLALYPSGC